MLLCHGLDFLRLSARLSFEVEKDDVCWIVISQA
jgi:hypothetical protein